MEVVSVKKSPNILQKLKSAPLAICFFAFLFAFMILDMSWPKRERSELENRTLEQIPDFSWTSLFKNEWTKKYDSYVKDQVVFRDQWIDLRGRVEYLQAKTENNEIIFGNSPNGTMMFTKFYSLGKNESTYLANAKAVEQFAQRHSGKVSFLLSPSASVVYKDNLPIGVPLADENSYLDEIFSITQSSAQNIDLRQVFDQHKDEYIFYRTDHHWTTYGAYLAYEEFCRLQGLTPFDLSAHQAVEIPDFYGTSYSRSRLWNTVPDVLTYYPLDNPMTIEVTGELKDTSSFNGDIYNTSALTTRDKYSAFLWGNNGYSTIEGNGTGSILVVKDSYGNSFAPFLTANYEKIGIIDLRYWPSNLEELAEEYDHILILHNFQSFYQDNGIRKLNLNINN